MDRKTMDMLRTALDRCAPVDLTLSPDAAWTVLCCVTHQLGERFGEEKAQAFMGEVANQLAESFLCQNAHLGVAAHELILECQDVFTLAEPMPSVAVHIRPDGAHAATDPHEQMSDAAIREALDFGRYFGKP